MKQYFEHRTENRGIKSKHLCSANTMTTDDSLSYGEWQGRGNGANPGSLTSSGNVNNKDK
jgi:hypothetical protein